jgi:hypothetical protein
VVVKEATLQTTAPPDDPESNPIDEIDDPQPIATASLPKLQVEEVVVDSLELRIQNHDPVRGTVSAGGIIKDGCLEITGWEQSISEDTIFIQPRLNRLEGDRCLDDQISFDEIIDLEIQERSIAELISDDYILDVNGNTMNLVLVLSSSLALEEEGIISLVKFEEFLKEAISTHDYDSLQELMDETFGFAFWRSEGYEVAPEEAIEQLQLSYLQTDNTIAFDDTLPDLSASLGEDKDIFSVWNPAANPVGALFSSGWGPDGASEAILIVGQSPEGIYAWDGIILAHGEMGGFTGQAPRETKTSIPLVDSVINVVMSNDMDARQELVRLITIGCTTADGLGGPPKCEAGQVEGAIGEYLPLGGPGEGSYALGSEVGGVLGFETELLYAAYVVSEDLPDDPTYPFGKYALIFSASGGESGPGSIVLRLDTEGYIVRLDGLGGMPLDFYFQQVAADLLDPPPDTIIFRSEAAEILVYPPGMQPAAEGDD